MRYALHLSYFGRNYAGWQRQNNAKSVQEEIEKVIAVLLKEKTDIIGCGRTDAGVHAVNFYAHFDTDRSIPEQFIYHANAMLGKDILLHTLFPVDEEWHARFSAISRTYRYFISQNANPFFTDYSWQTPYELDVKKMQEAAKILLDYNEFTSFAKLHGGQKTDICKIISVDFIMKNNIIIFEITADRFLRNMVRAIVGTLVDVGRSHCSIDEFKTIIEKKDRSAAGISAPAKGLFLMQVDYASPLNNTFVKNVKDFPYL